MTAPLHRQLAALRRAAGLTQKQAADRLGVTVYAVSGWEVGRHSPRLPHAIAYAHLVGRQLVVTGRDGAPVGPLPEVLPRLDEVRRERIHRTYLAQRMNVQVSAIGWFERRARHGQTRLSSLLAYLTAFGHGLDLAPLPAEHVEPAGRVA